MATTLRRCFVQPFNVGLDAYPSEPVTNTNPGSSSDTTANVTPPRFAHKVLMAHWTGLCNQFIATMPSNGLSDEYLSLKELVIRHASEGDVVRTAALYVLHPLNQAFSSHPQFAGTVTCLSELSATGLRADLTYFKNPPAPGAAKRAFAVVEFKRRQLINGREFENAEKLNSTVPEAQVPQRAGQVGQQAMGRNDDNTFYDNYSCKLMKQAAAYAMAHRTKYIALFNWETLVLVRFQAMNLLDNAGRLKSKESVRSDGVGEWCQTTVITQPGQMRPALLGFLAEAHIQTPF